jgi:hypothetical protein
MKPIRRLKSLGPFTFLLLGYANMLLGAVPDRLAAQTQVDRRAAIDADAYIRIHNIAGTLTVIGWDRDSVAVTGTVHEPAGRDGFYFGAGGDVAKMGIWSDDATSLEPSTLEVRVPAGARVWIKTGSADVRVTGVNGGVDISSVTGSIAVSGSPAELFAETLGGRIDIDADTRAVRAKTASGAIVVRGAIRDVIATSVSGNLDIEGDRFERGSFESVDGDIRYLGNVGRASALDFTAHSGLIDFALPADANADFVVGTFYGEFQDRFGVADRVTGSRLKGQEYRFTLGSGGGQVTVRNFKGRVVLRGKG